MTRCQQDSDVSISSDAERKTLLVDIRQWHAELQASCHDALRGR